jgi:hypothetical protein
MPNEKLITLGSVKKTDKEFYEDVVSDCDVLVLAKQESSIKKINKFKDLKVMPQVLYMEVTRPS